jgi:nucleotide-binding universal stress UspA family protein
MQRFTNILFVNDPVANSEPALRRAVQLARLNQAQLTIANISQELPASQNHLQHVIRELQAEGLAAMLDDIEITGLEVKTCFLLGTPFLEIIKQVMRSRHDLVIKPAEGRGGVSRILFGSTDLHLLRKCPSPVWIIKPSHIKPYARILAAVDPNPDEKSNVELNILILQLASSLARRENSELHIVHAWLMPHESILRSGRGNLPNFEIDRMVLETRKAHKKWFDELLGQIHLHDSTPKVHLLKGEASDVLTTLAHEKRVELIVMGTVARTGIPGFFIGNTAEKTLASVDCSVLAVKPKGFTSPVKA